LVSSLIGNKLPGPGAIFLSINFIFRKPVFIGDVVTAIGVIKGINYKKDILTLDVICYNQDNVIVTESTSEVKLIGL
jgi:3-hydroxybutyryl-CoA dehydratase